MEQQHANRTTASTGVLIVDDHPTVCEALTYAIEDEPGLYVAGQCGSAVRALALVEAQRPGVAIVDLMLSDAFGLDLVGSLLSFAPRLKIVVFSMSDELVYAERALRAGALAYLMKSEPTSRVMEAVRAVLQGDVFLSRRMTSRLLRGIGGSDDGESSTLDRLTDRELEVLHLLGQGFMVSEIEERLHLSRKTVEAYRRRASEKLGFGSTNELLHFAIRWMNGGKVEGASENGNRKTKIGAGLALQ